MSDTTGAALLLDLWSEIEAEHQNLYFPAFYRATIDIDYNFSPYGDAGNLFGQAYVLASACGIAGINMNISFDNGVQLEGFRTLTPSELCDVEIYELAEELRLWNFI